MVLTPHAIVGATLAGLVPEHPLVGFAFGFISHFVLDAIPHWDYQLDFFTTNSLSRGDLIKLTVDFVLGLSLIWFFAPALVWGALGGLTPDALQFVYQKTGSRLLASLQRFHLWIHAEKKL